MRKPKEKEKGRWFKGDVFSMPLKAFEESRRFEKNVMKPTALQTKKVKGQTFSRYYHKPVQPGEFLD